MGEWIHLHELLLMWLGALSILTVAGAFFLVPFLLVRIPEDYFTHRRRHHPERPQHPALRALSLALKNLLGYIFIIAGIVLLFLPGQGLIMMFLGVMLIDFPGKYTLERWIVEQPFVLHAINAIRGKAHHPPLEDPHASGAIHEMPDGLEH
jgi:hypothetical protein